MVLVMDEETVLKRLELNRDVTSQLVAEGVECSTLTGLRFQHQQPATQICLLFITTLS